jgi:hypothetical protein
VITLANGKTLTGHIIALTATELTIETTDNMRVTVSRNTVRMIETKALADYKHNDGGNPHKDAPSLFLTQSAFMLPKGKGYYETQYFTTHIVEYGLTDNVSIGGGILGLLALRVKAGVTIAPTLRVAAATEVVGLPIYINSSGSGGVTRPLILGATYGMATAGTRDRYFSAMGGIGYSALANNAFAVLGLSGFARIGKNIGIMTDNLIIPNVPVLSTSIYTYGQAATINLYIPTLGVRFIGKSVSVDLGLIGTNYPAVLALPYIGMKAHF